MKSVLSFPYILDLSKRYAYLFSFENLRNFQNKSMRDRHGGSHVYQRGAAIPISILLGFLRTFKRKTWVFAVPRFVFLSTSLLGTGKGKNK